MSFSIQHLATLNDFNFLHFISSLNFEQDNNQISTQWQSHCYKNWPRRLYSIWHTVMVIGRFGCGRGLGVQLSPFSVFDFNFFQFIPFYASSFVKSSLLCLVFVLNKKKANTVLIRQEPAQPSKHQASPSSPSFRLASFRTLQLHVSYGSKIPNLSNQIFV